MNSQEILTKAIEKAIANGWEPSTKTMYGFEYAKYGDGRVVVRVMDDLYMGMYIFSHDFARALWGEWTMAGRNDGLPHWKFHLQNMVIAEDPIKYLGEHLQ
jgi:hypothetical protein